MRCVLARGVHLGVAKRSAPATAVRCAPRQRAFFNPSENVQAENVGAEWVRQGEAARRNAFRQARGTDPVPNHRHLHLRLQAWRFFHQDAPQLGFVIKFFKLKDMCGQLRKVAIEYVLKLKNTN
jgi:hypothetical protein